LTIINNSLAAANVPVTDELVTGMLNQGVYYRGLQILGGGSTLGGLILGAIAVCIIDRHLMKAAGFALTGCILTFFGLMHGEQVGIGVSPLVSTGYLLVALMMVACSKFAPAPSAASEPDEHAQHGGEMAAAATS
jgi:AGZA family xanthine/uracil permease-like MFS transporter